MNRTPRTFDWLPAVDAPPAVEVAERLILAEEKFFGDGPPQWLEGRHNRPCQSAAEAQADRFRLVKRLRRFGQSDPEAELVALRLENCVAEKRCRSGACPECARAWQRWFTTATRGFLAHATPGGRPNTILSPVHPAGIIEPGGLITSAFNQLPDAVRAALTAAHLPAAVSGIDISFNEQLTADFRPHWSLHSRLFVPGPIGASEVKTLRTHFPPSDLIPRPLKVATFDGDLAGIAYGMKPEFGRRQSYVQTKATRQCRNTRGRPLRGIEAVELAVFLDRVGLRRRLILHGTKLVRKRDGSVVIRPDSPPARARSDS